MSRLRSTLTALDVRNLANWQALTAYLVFTVAGAWVAGGVSSGSVLLRIALPAVAGATGWIVIVVASALADQRGGWWRGAWVLMASATLVGTVRGVTLDALYFAFNLSDDARTGYRTLSGILASAIILPAFAYIAAGTRAHARRMADLLRVTAELEQARERGQQGITDRSTATATRIQDLLMAEVARLDPTMPEGSLATLQRTASEIVRPISHELASQAPTWRPTTALIDISGRVALTAVLSGRSTPRPFMPRLSAIAGALFTIPLAVSGIAAPWWLLPPVAAGLLTWGLLHALNEILASVHRHRPRLVPATAVLGLIGVGLIEGSLLLAVLPASTGQTGRLIAMGSWIFVPLLAACFGIVGSIRREQRAAQERLEELAAEVRWQLARVGQVQWQQQNALSRALHGPVQSAVTAGAIRLDSAIRTGGDVAGLVVEIQQDLIRVVDALSAAGPDDLGALDATLLRLKSTWEGLATIVVNLDPATRKRLSLDPIATMCVSELIGELTSNAVRHGGATTVEISLTCESTTATLLLCDDGSWTASEGTGLGSRLLQEMAIEVHQEREQGRTCIRATVPFDDSTDSGRTGF